MYKVGETQDPDVTQTRAKGQGYVGNGIGVTIRDRKEHPEEFGCRKFSPCWECPDKFADRCKER